MCLERRLSRIFVVALVVLASTAWLNAESLIKNASFEATGLPKYWDLLVLGGSPVVSMDTEVKVVGPRAVRIKADVETLAVIQQKVEVEPNRPYTLQGWVKTEGLKVYQDADMYGTLLVIPFDEPDVTKTVCGPNHKGTTDWTRIRLDFKGPPQGQATIACSFCGSGFATGTVWFDGLELVPTAQATTQPGPEAQPAQSELSQPPAKERTQPIKVTADLMTDQAISPLIYGNSVESGLDRQVAGLWSEMLFNRSFETIPPYKPSVWDRLDRQPDDDLTVEPWYHSGYQKNRWYLVGGNSNTGLEYDSYWAFRHGTQAVRVTNEFSSAVAWLAQDGMFLRKNVTYQVKGFLRIGGPGSHRPDQFDVKVGFYQGKDLDKAIVEKTITGVTSEWKPFKADLPCGPFESRATFALSVPANTEFRVDDLSLQPSDNIHGWRREAVEAMKRVHPREIRFPGGCFASFYNWRDGIGPQSDRRPSESEYWGGLEYNDVGTAEFISLCREVAAEPLLCVNLMTGTAEDAADWVAYCNMPESHPLGALRKRHGYAAPFAVQYWELGNEPYRKYEADEYAARCVDFAQAMKKVDPSIKLILAGYGPFQEMLKPMLAKAGALIDLVSDRRGDERQLRSTLAVVRDYNAKHGRDIKLCNTQWLASSDDVPVSFDASDHLSGTLQQRLIRWRYAMNVARQLLVFQRLGGDFALASFNGMANTWGQNVLECPKEGPYLSAAGRVFELFSQSPAAWPLKIQAAQPSTGLVTQAAWDADKQQLVLIAINDDKAAKEIPFDLTSLNLKANTVEISTLHAVSPATYNSLADPEAIKRIDTQKTLDSTTEFVLEAPPNSVVQAVLH